MNDAKKVLRHLGGRVDQVSSDTWRTWCSHWATAGWLHSQSWAWDGGDAIVGIVGDITHAKPWVAIRIGSTVHVLQCEGVNAAMAAFGLDPGEYRVAVG